MSLITLKGIGKIYVSGNNVAVGIRGVNLSFDKGEFVAITGTSGSGKSTLLNVISGMDSYEEGEMYIEGEPTSHYVQQDWEEYRKKYISFIFQDYNIIDSFTVLQNVELALMHIENPKLRRQRAVELLRRVGLEKHLNHKGSKLSGGQKQRTVIARALAKDSPIILADEPTGNLDSQTSKEIIELLREVSKDKLVIIVTHNFEQVEAYATRHIRVFDGAIEADQVICSPAVIPESKPELSEADDEKKRYSERKSSKFKRNLRNGLSLGGVRFRATPKLSVFLCILMTLSALAMTFVTSLSGEALGLFDKNNIFTHKDGRLVIIRQDGAVISDDELNSLSSKVGADSYMHYDYLLDRNEYVRLPDNDFYSFAFSYGDFDGIDIGRAPQKENEVVLRVPVSMRRYYGSEDFSGDTIPNVFGIVDYTVVGIDYYYDNTKTPEMVFTAEGYKYAAALAYFSQSLQNFRLDVKVTAKNSSYSESTMIAGNSVHVSFDIGEKSYYINSQEYNNIVESFKLKTGKDGYDIKATMSGAFINYDYNYSNGYYPGVYYEVDVSYYPAYGSSDTVSSVFDNYAVLDGIPEELASQMKHEGYSAILSPDIINDFMTEHYYSKSYTQASLFFDSDLQANAKVAELREFGYTAVPSDAVAKSEGIEVIIKTMSLLFTAIGWILAVVFITLFISLCSTRAMLATKGDIAILRSMGISTPVIRISIYVQTLLALIPAYIVTAVAAVLIFTIPQTNAIFSFLHTWEYIVIAVALFAISLRLSKRYVKKMFGSSVKKTLKGDAEA